MGGKGATGSDPDPPADPRPVLLYDGECGFCARSVRFVLDHNSAADVRFASLQSDYGRDLRARHEIDTTELSSLVFVEGDRAYRLSAASARVARHLDWPYRAGAALVIVPRPLRDAAYEFVARHRHRLMPSADACRIPTRAESDRFLG